MRIRLRTRPSVLFGALVVVALLLFLPMRLALGWAGIGEEGFTARRVTGSIWDATLADARFGDLVLGTLDARLSPLALLVGRARIVVDGAGSSGTADGGVHGAILTSRSMRGVDRLSGTIPTGRVFAPLPVTALTLDEVSVRFLGDRCDSAEGRVTAALGGDVSGIPLPPTVSGNVRCQDGALVLPLASQSGAEAVTLTVTGAGTYTAALSLAPADPVAAQQLSGLGFIGGAGGYTLSVQGSF